MTGEDSFLDSTENSDEETIDDVDRLQSDEVLDIESETDTDARIDDESLECDVSELVDGDVGVITRERDEYLDALRRLQADFENYRKRTTRQQTELLDRASRSLVERLLPVLDTLDLALAHGVGQGADVQADDLTFALAQIAGLARGTLEKEGLERIDEIGVPFDPTIHDAVSRIEREDSSDHEQTVADVMRAGYRLNGQVIRPAMVAVKS